MAKIVPIGDRIVVKLEKNEEKTRSGIVLPDTAKEKPQRGTVVEVGSGKLLDNGKKAEPEVKKGDTIIFSKYAGTEIKVDEEKYLILSENDVLAIIR